MQCNKLRIKSGTVKMFNQIEIILNEEQMFNTQLSRML